MEQAKKSKKHRKVSRNAAYCKMYAATHRRERNKIRRLKKHLKVFVADKVAQECLHLLKLKV